VSRLLIRKATEADATAIAQVHVSSWRSTYAGIVTQDHIDRLSVEDFARRWQARLDDSTGPPQTILVASDERDAVVGFISGGKTRNTTIPFDAELYAIYLLNEFQQRGVGRRLVRELATDLIEQDYTSLCVSVLADNPARHFYEHLGAVWIRNEPHPVGGATYQASWYGWADLHSLAAKAAQGSRNV
jgi:ribosomal protein S18 acetylase RimI-like enzyme